MTKNQKVVIGLICGLVACLSVFCFNHLDLEYISTWGVSLLEHIFQGNLSSYAIDLFEMDYGTNYNLFQNANVALWVLPLYIFSSFTKITIPMIVYQTWIKIVITVLHVLCARELYKVIKILGFEERKAYISALLYLASPIVMIHGIGIGQIDCIGILFLLISIRLYLEKKYYPMAVAMGFAMLSKLFVVIVYVPLFLLYFKEIKQTWKYGALALAIPFIDKLITGLLIKDYSLQSQVHNSQSFYPRLFAVSINYESLILMLVMILCGVCLLLGNRGIRKPYYWLLFPSVIFFLFLLFVFWHPQWILYILPVLLIMGCYVANEYEYAFFYMGFSAGFALHSLVNCNTNWFNAILIRNSLFGKYVEGNNLYIGKWMGENISSYVGNAGYTVLMAAFALLIVLYYINVRKEHKTETIVQAKMGVWIGIILLPVISYMLVLFMAYFGGIG